VNSITVLGITKALVRLPKGKWTEELIKVAWNHNNLISISTGFTSFKLLFGDEAVTPEDIRLASARVIASTEDQDNFFFERCNRRIKARSNRAYKKVSRRNNMVAR
jgi:hypothetical protein